MTQKEMVQEAKRRGISLADVRAEQEQPPVFEFDPDSEPDTEDE